MLVRDLESTSHNSAKFSRQPSCFSHDSGGSLRHSGDGRTPRPLTPSVPRHPVLALSDPVHPVLSGESRSGDTLSAKSASPLWNTCRSGAPDDARHTLRTTSVKQDSSITSQRPA